ncbi:hypothetical protein [Vagococcus hydrophili]|uniref:Uncharacterized protein n=1 Tax=Vagococcus hydrophili TaxID=2714947 RepID=A0A6G8APR1_9ENTE|nr:hypothetical protein [Vagococcus hydrophili]QIL47064.1 hypothetical protein G7082_00225 [Vagococcus hydrophili]
MTQENKLEWVKELICELTEECQKQGISLVMQASSEKHDFASSSISGSDQELGLNLLLLESNIEEDTGKTINTIKRQGAESVCDCPRCTAKREDKSVKSENTPDDVLFKFLEALFSVAESGGLDD